MKLTRVEQETIIRFDEESGRAEIYTNNSRLKRRLTKLCSERSEECRQTEADGCGGLTFTFPKTWIKVNPTRILSEKQLQHLAEIANTRLSVNINGEM